MFGGNSGTKGGDSVVDTLIGRQTEILGDVRFSGGLHVDGKIKGKVVAESGNKGASLSVSENGTIEGDIRVPSIVLNGRVTGDVYAGERVHLAAKARVNGNVYYKILEMEAGAEINGQLVRDTGDIAGKNAASSSGGVTPVPAPGGVDELSEIRKLKGA